MGGAASSTASSADEVKVLESRLTASGDLCLSQNAFANLCAWRAGSGPPLVAAGVLQECFTPTCLTFRGTSRDELGTDLGVAIAEQVFGVHGDGSLDWKGFLKAFQRACKQSLGAEKLKLLLSLLPHISKTVHQTSVAASGTVGNARPDSGDLEQALLVGSITVDEFRQFLGLCWRMTSFARLHELGTFKTGRHLQVEAPDLEPLCGAARLAIVSEEDGDRLPIDSLSAWILSTLTGLCDCLSQYVEAQLQRVAAAASETGENVGDYVAKEEASDDEAQLEEDDSIKTGLMNAGTAWAVGLCERDTTLALELIRASPLIAAHSLCAVDLIYRSSAHGRGMNRFFTHVQGYQGPVLFLIAAKSGATESSRTSRWVIGALVPEGLDNKETCYGNNGCCLFAIMPHFLQLRATGKDKFFVYSHRQVAGMAYRAKSRAEGIGFGGDHGKERVWVDEDLAWITVRHHAVDKTYHSGALVPGQGYAPVKDEVLEVEVWGLGGQAARDLQAAYRQRENLFTEQRRKVDLKDFAIEKTMMEMMSDPNKAGREER